MDPMIQRMQVAQDLIQSLVNLLSLPTMPQRVMVQAMLDQAAMKIKAIEVQQATPAVPLVVPNLLPAAEAAVPKP